MLMWKGPAVGPSDSHLWHCLRASDVRAAHSLRRGQEVSRADSLYLPNKFSLCTPGRTGLQGRWFKSVSTDDSWSAPEGGQAARPMLQQAQGSHLPHLCATSCLT